MPTIPDAYLPAVTVVKTVLAPQGTPTYRNSDGTVPTTTQVDTFARDIVHELAVAAGHGETL